MNKLMILAAGLSAACALPAMAMQTPPAPPTGSMTGQAAPPRMAPQTAPPAAARPMTPQAAPARPMAPGAAPMTPQARPQTAPQTAPPTMRPGGQPMTERPMADRAMGEGQYGRWDSSWGPQPPAPPSTFTRTADWHSHVRACQQRYRSYDPRTDMFVPRAGRTARCSL